MSAAEDAQAVADAADTADRQWHKDAAMARVAASRQHQDEADTLAAFSWTQPCCLGCWIIRHPGRLPVRLRKPYRASETCVFCAETADDGIYLRIDPKVAAHPTLTRDET